MVAKAVMMIGRTRNRAPALIDSSTVAPSVRFWLIRSIKTIAFVTTMPMSMSMPIMLGIPTAESVRIDKPNAPVKANGIEINRISGWISERNVATMIR